MPGNLQPFKELPAVLPDIKKIFQHPHRQRLPKTPGTGDQVHLKVFLKQFPNDPRLIHIITVAFPKLAEAVNAIR